MDPMLRSVQAFTLLLLWGTLPVDGDDPPAGGAAPEQQGGGSEQALRALIDGLEAVRKGPVPIAEIAKKLAADMEAARVELRAVRVELESARKEPRLPERSKKIEERIAALESREEKVLARLDAVRITIVLLTKKLPRPEALQLLSAVTAQPARAIDPARAEASRALYRDRVGPLLASSCLRCHDDKKKKGELVLRTREQALIGGAQGPAIAPGKPEASLLYLHVSGSKEPRMPPGKELTPAEVEAIREWIESGAAWVYPDEREF